MFINNKGFNQTAIQELNRALVLNVLRKQGVCSRSVIAQATGLQQATVTYIVNDLIDMGFVCETGLIKGIKGRRSIGITLAKDVYRVVGIQIARKRFSVALFDLSGEILKINKVDTNNLSPPVVMNKIIETVSEITNNQDCKKLLGIGIAVPGPFINENNKIAMMTGVPGWKEIDIYSQLYDAFNVNILIEHDANAGAFSYYWLNEDVTDNDVLIYIAAGPGIGAGIISNGKLFRGYQGTAGEIGHISVDYNGIKCECGNNGCLEKYASTMALVENLSEKLNKKVTISEVKMKINSGVKLFCEEYKDKCEMLGIGVAGIINFYNPNIIIIGDELSHIDGSILLEAVNKQVTKRIIPQLHGKLRIMLSNNKESSALMGAASLVINKIFKNPNEYLNM